ncbi:MAG: CARDB domain-containing protein, partial [Chitinophagaceae bacterium]
LKPDLAIHLRDIKIVKATEGFELSLLLHNIGNSAATGINVLLTIDGKAVDSVRVQQLDAPNDLNPRVSKVILKSKQIKAGQRFQIDVAGSAAEVTMLNNNIHGTFARVGEELSISL